MTIGIMDETGEQAGFLAVGAQLSIGAIVGQLGLDLLPEPLINDAVMLAIVDLTAMGNPADIERVLKQSVKRTT